MKRPIKSGYLMDVILCRKFVAAKRKTVRWAKQRANKDERRQAQRDAADELVRMREERGL